MTRRTRRATITTTHDTPTQAAQIVAALRPDNTADMKTVADGTTVETRIERETTGGLQSTIDDYVVNLRVAAQLTRERDSAGATGERTGTGTNTNTGIDTDTNRNTNTNDNRHNHE